MTDKWSFSDASIALIGAAGANIPKHEVLHYQALRAVPEKAKAIVKAVGLELSAVDDDVNLSAEGKQSKGIQLGKRAIANLQQIQPGDSVARRKEGLKRKIENDRRDSAPPKDSAISAEIRAHIKNAGGAGRSVMEALKMKGDRRVVSALLDEGAPPFLSGMTEQDLEAFRNKIQADTPEAKELIEIERAEHVGRQAIRSAIGMIANRVGISERQDGTWRSNTGDTV